MSIKSLSDRLAAEQHSRATLVNQSAEEFNKVAATIAEIARKANLGAITYTPTSVDPKVGSMPYPACLYAVDAGLRTLRAQQSSLKRDAADISREIERQIGNTERMKQVFKGNCGLPTAAVFGVLLMFGVDLADGSCLTSLLIFGGAGFALYALVAYEGTRWQTLIVLGALLLVMIVLESLALVTDTARRSRIESENEEFARQIASLQKMRAEMVAVSERLTRLQVGDI